MAINIVWSPRALDNFHDVIAYLERNWNSQVIKVLVIRTEKVIHLISHHPQMLRQISEHTSIGRQQLPNIIFSFTGLAPTELNYWPFLIHASTPEKRKFK